MSSTQFVPNTTTKSILSHLLAPLPPPHKPGPKQSCIIQHGLRHGAGAKESTTQRKGQPQWAASCDGGKFTNTACTSSTLQVIKSPGSARHPRPRRLRARQNCKARPLHSCIGTCELSVGRTRASPIAIAEEGTAAKMLSLQRCRGEKLTWSL